MNRQQKRFVIARDNLLAAYESHDTERYVEVLAAMLSASIDLRKWEFEQVEKLIRRHVSSKSIKWQEKARLIHHLTELIYTAQTALDKINNCSD